VTTVRRLGVALLLSGCAEQVDVGLANAQSIESQNRPTRHHDVIANGDDSCPRTPGGNDPLRNRAPPCDGADDAGRPAPLSDAGAAETSFQQAP
jgi:hypothetical protein